MTVFTYLALIEGIVIVSILCWEIYWLRKVYYILSDSANKMEKMVAEIKLVVKQLEATSGPIAGLIKMFTLPSNNAK